MKAIERRVKRIEDKLNVGKRPVVVEVVHFGGGELPPNRTEGGMAYRYVHYNDVKKKNQSCRKVEI